jgi:glutathione reductase (NADPH)
MSAKGGFMEEFDLVVIGAGSGGFAAARVAAGYGKRVALIDKGP